MMLTLRGKFGISSLPRRNKCTQSLVSLRTKQCAMGKCRHYYHHWTHNSYNNVGNKKLLLLVEPQLRSTIRSRGIGTLVYRFLKGALKLRYLLLGGAVGGGMSLHKSYQDWKQSLPDISWLESYMPSSETLDSFRGKMITFKDKVADIEIGAVKNNSVPLTEKIQKMYEGNSMKVNAFTFGAAPEPKRSDNAEKRVESLQQELIEVQLKYQKEIERLEKDNKELKKQILLNKSSKIKHKQIKKSLIDMYSEVLDELADYDSSYSAQDHLPRVVVVGDQSSGKTSVLEMIAQARIFPRGAGEMMTRAPVKVTLSEGPYHIAQFKDSDREFDLTKEDDLAKLRTEVELRMKRSLSKGKSVSQDVISMTVKGPGIQRMVLVDLPGIISTVTKDMAEDTRDCIKKITQAHMSNPNAIILCIQDGSVDAERSNVTDLVSQIDPGGKRTIFVLTKVDMAEENLTNPHRIQKILSGRLFPMKALGYFAVVTGRGRKEDSISEIKQYEEQFFRNSKLFRESALSTTQLTTRNLSFAVAECFWKMVRETVEQQADAFKATRFNLETEWNNTFPRIRELDRDELFEKARGEILDEVVNLSQVSVKDWEALLLEKIWNKVKNNVVENIYLPASQTQNRKSFNTMVDIRLKEWTESQLADRSIEAGSDALRQEFVQFVDKSMSAKESDPIFHDLKKAVLEEALKRHRWESKGNEMLRMIQLNALEDRCVNDKQQWDLAVKFLENTLKERLQMTESQLKEMLGPGTKERWLYWKYATEEQTKRNAVKSELEKIIYSDYNHSATLNADEITAVKKNLQRNGVEVNNDFVRETWAPVYRRHFINSSIARAYDCRRGFYLYHQGHTAELDCQDVVVFWRLEQMLKVTANALRQQVMNREARRLDKIIKEVLEDFSQDQEIKVNLLTGRRVTLAEELKRVRQIQEKLEEFIQALNKEK
ncbi:opa1 mitochondrial dynamin like GTPase isoform X7 [Rhodnius prolixus]|uniref:opa1 mitochondrial dynamin like GTPase isoform X7 n=1 Tax=Rhodnius prolixus TaxID=13249 RepID=UPI003D18D001